MSNLKLVRESLANLQSPRFSDSVWVASFELLMGAAYALLAAERHGYSRRDGRKYEYHTHVRGNIAAIVAEHGFTRPVSEQPLFDDWVSGFYFNAAEQRILWAADRLLTTFAAIDCPCGRSSELRGHGRHSFAEVWKAASLRLEHVGTEHQKDLTHVAVLLRQSAVERHRACEMAFSPDAVLSMLRDHLEHKHGYTLDGHRKTVARPRLIWSTAAPGVQLEFVCAAFSLLCQSYDEMMNWHADARDSVLTALGELA
ncbi:MAG TPA: hypothetical protein VMT05_01210 [Terriglobales bacterium]|nr:hypothetical protein [Terriglobales bacterium]